MTTTIMRRALLAEGGSAAAVRATLRVDARGDLVRVILRAGELDEDDPVLTAPGWPRCACNACGCDSPAQLIESDGGEVSCGGCADYAVDDDGHVRCSRCEDVEHVTETCGAGGQTRTYLRVRPPRHEDAD